MCYTSLLSLCVLFCCNLRRLSQLGNITGDTWTTERHVSLPVLCRATPHPAIPLYLSSRTCIRILCTLTSAPARCSSPAPVCLCMSTCTSAARWVTAAAFPTFCDAEHASCATVLRNRPSAEILSRCTGFHGEVAGACHGCRYCTISDHEHVCVRLHVCIRGI